MRTHTSYFRTIHKGTTGVHVPTAIPVTASRLTPTGHQCPPDPDPVACATGLEMLVFGDISFAFAERASTEPRAQFTFAWTPDTGDPNVHLQHRVDGPGPKSAFKVTSNDPQALEGATVDYSIMAPFVTGHGTFTGTGLPETQAADCPTIRRDGTFAIALKARIDGVGEVFWPGDTATIFRVGR